MHAVPYELEEEGRLVCLKRRLRVNGSRILDGCILSLESWCGRELLD